MSFPQYQKGCLEATVHSLHVSRKIKETIPDARSAVVEPTDPPQEEGPPQSSHTDGADQAKCSRYGGQCPTTTHSGYHGRIPTITFQRLSLPRAWHRQDCSTYLQMRGPPRSRRLSPLSLLGPIDCPPKREGKGGREEVSEVEGGGDASPHDRHVNQ